MKTSFLAALLTVFVTTSVQAASQCWSSAGGNGEPWLKVKVLASDEPVKDVQVSLQSAQWRYGAAYAYETQCTDAQGYATFRKSLNPASECIYTYSNYWNNYGNQRYCNWASAYCYQYCYEHPEEFSDTSYWGTFTTEGYKVQAYPVWDSPLSERYERDESDSFDIDFDQLAQQELSLIEKDIILRLRVQDDTGRAVTSGVSLYASGSNSYSHADLNASFEDLYVIAGTYYISGWESDWNNRRYACISNKKVTVAEEDVFKEVTLTAKTNSASVSGVVIGSDSLPLNGASVSLYNSSYGDGSEETCYAYGWATTDYNGRFHIAMPPGSYSLWVYPPWNGSENSYSNAQESVTLQTGEAVTKNMTLLRKDAQVAGTTMDNLGQPVENSYMYGWNYSDEDSDWIYDQSDANGVFAAQSLSNKRYNVSAYYWNWNEKNNRSHCALEGMQTIVSPISDLTFTFPILDHTVNIYFVDENGNTLDELWGGASVRPADAGNTYWCSEWAYSQNQSAVVQTHVQSGRSYIVEPYSWGMEYDPEETSFEFDATSETGSTDLKIQMLPVDAKIKGQFLDEEGNEVSLETTWFSAYATRSGLWRSATVDSGYEYEIEVSAGRWCIGYWLDSSSGYASVSPGSGTNCVDVASGETKNFDIPLLKTARIQVHVQDSNGNPMKWAWVRAGPYSAGDQGGDIMKRCWDYGNGCSTDSEGNCTITVGSTTEGITYFVNASRPWSEMLNENLTLPEETSVLVKSGETAAAPDLVFRTTDGELQITLSSSEDSIVSSNISLINPVINSTKSLQEEVVSSAYISCYSELGGVSETNADDTGKAVIKCASGDLWYCFAINLIHNDLYLSESAEALCEPLPAVTEMGIKLNATGTAVPDAVSQSWDAGDSHTLQLSDNFSIYFPSATLADAGETVSCMIQPDPYLPYQSSRRPTNQYGYNIDCYDSDKNAIKQFKKDATLCLPIWDEQLANLDLEAQDIQLVYRDPSTDAYISLSNVTVDPEKDIICGLTNHLTEFVLVGNGNRKGADGDTEDAGEEATRTGEQETGGTPEEGGTGVIGAASGGSGCGSCQVGGAAGADNALWLFLAAGYYFSTRRRRQ